MDFIMFLKQDLAIAAFLLVGMQGVGCGGSVTAVTSAQEENFSAPQVRVISNSEFVRSDIVVRVTMINRGPGAFRLLRWNLPADGDLTNSLFEITRNGKPLGYRGRMVKRRVTAADYIRMEPDKPYSAEISLAQAYETGPRGRYKVRYSAYNQTAEDAKKMELIEINSSELVIEKK
jgi:hypothetical protein